ncbi:hypothetical protein A9Q84_16800 [Halobacteriovorax marinus]|uniref:Uncharacterized protein n=1 Tax=Halobacteriovorax marinus TaxID=97084 RepID=A0A1Y5F8I0_9BACT|nr:hypothetical protein A9Q84_16800 [Halobacteriovorax marinus]
MLIAFIFLNILTIDFSLANDESLESQKVALTQYLCLATKTEYFHCKKHKLSACTKSNRKRYYEDLECMKTLMGLELEKWSEHFKERPFEWTKTCVSVKKEYFYCKKTSNSYCVDSMIDRYNEIICSKILEFDLK